MTTRRRLTREQTEEIATLREQGWSIARIARRFGCSIGAVEWHCLKFAADPPGAKPALPYSGPMAMMRGGHQVRRFTASEDAMLLALESSGLNHSEIGRRLGRRPNSVNGRLFTLARRDARAEAPGAE